MLITFVGSTHLSLVYGISSAVKGHKVNFFYPDQKIIKNFKSKKFPIKEPNLNFYYKKLKSKIFFSSAISSISNSDIICVAPDIKTDDNSISNLNEINNLINQILKLIKKEQILLIMSQVPPGFTRKIYEKHKQTFYMVETLVFGEAFKRALEPERIIIGCDKSRLPQKLKKYLLAFSKTILPMKFESAEFSKLCINIYLASSIITTNTLCELCEKLNANWSDISEGLKLDKRIGKYAYLKPGLGISGGNIERDLISIQNISKKNKVNSNYIDSIIIKSLYFKDWVITNLERLNIKKSDIGILGLSYKENTASIKNSPSIRLINKLIQKNLTKSISVYDPKVKSININGLKYKKNLKDLVSSCKILIIITPWKEFSKISYDFLSKNFKGTYIFDPFNMIKYKSLKKNKFKIFARGIK